MIPRPSGPELPALIAGAGKKAAWRFLEFFTVNIRNKYTRAARAAAASCAGAKGRGLEARARPAGACGRVYRTIAR
jgi:hypothetical protein